MEWISVDKYLPGKKLPDDAWIIVRCINKDHHKDEPCFFYFMALFSEGTWTFFDDDRYISVEKFKKEERKIKQERKIDEEPAEFIVTHWMIPDQIK